MKTEETAKILQKKTHFCHKNLNFSFTLLSISHKDKSKNEEKDKQQKKEEIKDAKMKN